MYLRTILFSLAWLMSCGPAMSEDNYGCTVLLCLANPKGPMEALGCAPPIQQLYRDLAAFKPFPSCSMSGGAYAEHGSNYYDQCPDSTTALGPGDKGIQGTSPSNITGNAFVTGIGAGDGLQPSMENALGNKICVEGYVGVTMITTGHGDGVDSFPVNVYQRIVTMAPLSSPRFIDVFINNKKYRRVRW